MRDAAVLAEKSPTPVPTALGRFPGNLGFPSRVGLDPKKRWFCDPKRWFCDPKRWFVDPENGATTKPGLQAEIE